MASASTRTASRDFSASGLGNGFVQTVKLRSSVTDRLVMPDDTPAMAAECFRSPHEENLHLLGRSRPANQAMDSNEAATQDTRSGNQRYCNLPELSGLGSQQGVIGSTLHVQTMMSARTTHWESSIEPEGENDEAHPATPSSHDGGRRHDNHGELVVSALLPLAQLIQCRRSTPRSPPAATAQDPSSRENKSFSSREPDLVSSDGVEHSGTRVRVKTERRREQCRANQARYRNKQRALRLDLEETVATMRKEVAELEAKRHSLIRKVNTKLTPWCIVAEYFRLFRYGASFSSSAIQEASMKAIGDRLKISGRTSTDSPGSQAQLEFLRSVVSPDVHLVGSAVHNLDALVTQWVLWSQLFDDVEVLLERVEASVEANTIVAASSIRVTISDSTVRHVFPHLISQSGEDSFDGPSGSQLAWQLCGQQLEFKVITWFTCDQQTSQVLRLRSQLDLVPAMRRALNSLFDVARVLDGAQLTPDGILQLGNLAALKKHGF